MTASRQVLEWVAIGEAKAQGRDEGKIEGWIEALLIVLKARFPPGAPADLQTAIQATTSLELLQNWIDIAITVDSLDAFRRAAGL